MAEPLDRHRLQRLHERANRSEYDRERFAKAALVVVPELLSALDAAKRERDDARAALAEAERWLRTIAANPYSECPHAGWAREAQHDVDVAHLKIGGDSRG